MRSLQTRLSTGLLLSLMVVFSVQWLLVSRVLHYLMEDYIVSRLEQDADVLLSSMNLDKTDGVVLDVSSIDPRYAQPFSGSYYLVTMEGQRLRSRSLWDEDLSVPAVVAGEMRRLRMSGPEQQALLVVVRGFRKQEHDLSIAIAENLLPVEQDIEHFQWRYAAFSIVILLLLIVLHMWMVRRGLRPLEHVRREMQALEKGEIQQLDRNVPGEVAPLVDQVNRLLGAMQQRLQRSRNALGNLAHALKTPLTALVQLCEREEIAQYSELRAQLDRHTHTVRELIDRELKRARLAGSAVPAQQYALEPEVAALIDILKTIYRTKALQFDVKFPAHALCIMDREDLLELLGNVLDNASKWAVRRIALTVEEGQVWTFRVEDDGPGVPADKLASLAQRGIRIDEHMTGNGLGLSIVKDLVQHYGGEIIFGRSFLLGGFLVEARVPLGGAPGMGAFQK